MCHGVSVTYIYNQSLTYRFDILLLGNNKEIHAAIIKPLMSSN